MDSHWGLGQGSNTQQQRQKGDLNLILPPWPDTQKTPDPPCSHDLGMEPR